MLLVAAIGLQDPHFFRVQNLLAIGTTIAVFGLLAVGQTVVILLGALDISVGSMTGLASVGSATAFAAPASSAIGVAAALGVGLLCGLVNGAVF